MKGISAEISLLVTPLHKAISGKTVVRFYENPEEGASVGLYVTLFF